MRQEFIKAFEANRSIFGVELSREKVERLAEYYQLVQEHNPLLHLVAPCSPEEFAIRHILESLTLLEFLPRNTRIADVGTGAGLPSIPCLIARGDLGAVLVESTIKKAAFLETALGQLGLAERAAVINRQFEEVKEKDFTYVTCRALDKFTERLPRLLKWTGPRQFLFFGGPSLEQALIRLKRPFEMKLMPLSNQRVLFIVK